MFVLLLENRIRLVNNPRLKSRACGENHERQQTYESKNLSKSVKNTPTSALQVVG